MDLKMGHISMQWSDKKEERQADIEKVLAHANDQGWGWITGTEAESPGIKDQFEAACVAAGFRFYGWSEIWIAVRETRIEKGWETEHTSIVKGNRGRYPSRGVIRVSYVDTENGVTTVLASHYQTQGISREPERKDDNALIAKEIGRMAKAHGGGSARVFFGADVNMPDNKKDVFFGEPLTSCWDELGKHPKTTGWGTIDVIASYNDDTWVKCKDARAYPDSEFSLNTDHYMIEATYEVAAPPKPPPPPKPTRTKLASPPVIDGTPAKHSGLTGNKPIRRIVIHSAVMPCEPGRARQLGRMNSEGMGGGSWHYAVDPEETFQTSWDSVICWHAPPNPHTVGIEMADYPKPWPAGSRTQRWWEALKRAWRWRDENHQKMLARTARLTAELLVEYELPVKLLSVKQVRNDEKGIATHNTVSKAFKQSTHWDPGAWPYSRFMMLVKSEVKKIKAG